MALLALDTTGDNCGVLVRRKGEADVARVEDIGRGHDAALAPLVANVLSSAGVKPGDLERIAVAVGPGSFTGVRVGVAFARGLSLALGAPAVGVSNLDVLAHSLDAPEGTSVVAIHDARRGEVVWRAYRTGDPVTDISLDLVEAASAALSGLAGEGEVLLAGSGASLVAGDRLRDSGVRSLSMGSLADLAERLDPAAAPASPFYHRPPDAKLPGGRDPSETP